MTRTKRAIVVAIAIGLAAYKVRGERPQEAFEAFDTLTVTTGVNPGIVTTAGTSPSLGRTWPGGVRRPDDRPLPQDGHASERQLVHG